MCLQRLCIKQPFFEEHYINIVREKSKAVAKRFILGSFVHYSYNQIIVEIAD